MDLMTGRPTILAAAFVCVAAAQTTPAARLAQWKRVDMPLPAGLSPKERQMGWLMIERFPRLQQPADD